MIIKKINNVYGIGSFEGNIEIFKDEIIYASNGTCKTSLINIIENIFNGVDPDEYIDRLTGHNGEIILEIDGEEINSNHEDFKLKVNEKTNNTYFTTINKEKINNVFSLLMNNEFIINKELYNFSDISDEVIEDFDVLQEILKLLKESYSTIDEIDKALVQFIESSLLQYDKEDITLLNRGQLGHKKISRYSEDVKVQEIREDLHFKDTFIKNWTENDTLNIIDLFNSKVPQDIKELKEIINNTFKPKLLSEELFIYINDDYVKFQEFWKSIEEEINKMKNDMNIIDDIDIISIFYEISQKLKNKTFEKEARNLVDATQDQEIQNKLSKLIKSNNKISMIIEPLPQSQSAIEKVFPHIKFLSDKANTEGLYNATSDSEKEVIAKKIVEDLKSSYKEVLDKMLPKIDETTIKESIKMFENFPIKYHPKKERTIFNSVINKIEIRYFDKILNSTNLEYLSEGEKTYAFILLDYLIAQTLNKDEILIILDDTGDRLDAKNKHMFIGLIKEITGHFKSIKKPINLKFFLHNFDYSVSIANAFRFKEITRYENVDDKLERFSYELKEFENGINVFSEMSQSIGVLPLLRELSKNYFSQYKMNQEAKTELFHYVEDKTDRTISEIINDSLIEDILDPSVLEEDYIAFLKSRVEKIITLYNNRALFNLKLWEINEKKIEMALYIRVVFHKHLHNMFPAINGINLFSYSGLVDSMSDQLKDSYKKAVYTTNDYIHVNHNFINPLLDTSLEEMVKLVINIKEEIENGRQNN